VKSNLRTSRVVAFFVAAALVVAFVAHASHGHDGAQAAQLHATCVVCQLGSPVAAQPAPAVVAAEAAPICHLSIADRDHAIPSPRVAVDLSRAPPAFLAS
jgi:hypothetical protein